ncbi:GNAT family N-acetyltransferase [Gilliamella apicola]|uniref:GNAT family N-acetyltransferase n=1 Tax=Gilliamella apicola TaxID=1196095 RepID=UPI003FA5F97B
MFELEWAKNLCNNFNSYSEFVEIGLGFIVLKYNVIFSKALSYLVYNDSIEVDTLAKEIEKGLTLTCSANLLLACLECQVPANWDRHNRESLKKFTKLGYILK